MKIIYSIDDKIETVQVRDNIDALITELYSIDARHGIIIAIFSLYD